MPKKIATRKIKGETYFVSKQAIKQTPKIKKINAKKFHKISGELLKESEAIDYLTFVLYDPFASARFSAEERAVIADIYQRRTGAFNKKIAELQQLAANNDLPMDEILKQLKKRKIGRRLVRKKN